MLASADIASHPAQPEEASSLSFNRQSGETIPVGGSWKVNLCLDWGTGLQDGTKEGTEEVMHEPEQGELFMWPWTTSPASRNA